MKLVPLGAATGRIARIATPQKIRRRAGRRWLRAALSRIFATLHEWRRRSRDRTELARLDERMLRDIGVSPGEVWHEINKPFWRE